ncbi:SUF system NifU family Fe-S cluster assembly protein [Leptospira santarosai]|uniref:Nitrogen-fixing protein NifU n=1 Tax=Leptospira santarosai serovar Shermani str. LT 821 TaxID=758847 RepID=K8Y7S4_9LEPT|nr:SUF system NifU family Fe-S cluster assembly protein [Leptospira santarosai]EKT85815.1 nitrogen-fixing protein NifU [Leptospira santarosai serovar Shermani str. LT 821]EPG81779.1 SUF system FeS assembly protein, NifU family [Leptospira santarosai serovar Shermani str. 1342KT]MDI7187688.1 SUF system NifU family Fe-S cluster assembly protein [Leptospira santarosai]MDI7197211.1 SUF system NifU family Fe-S cluster assembly protein [Leptospira santarosai]MDI7201463.1 SUF system NifU family Fe-S 
MSLSDNLYKEVILDHYQNPRFRGKLEPADLFEHGINPLCGDELELTINLNGDRIEEIRVAGKGCSISQASGSMMAESIQGKTIAEAENILSRFKNMFLEDKDPKFDEELEDLESMESVKKIPARVKCAVLPWNTLERALARATK